MKEREIFKTIIDNSIKENEMFIFNMIIASMISYDNNITEEEIKENCRLIDVMIESIEEYTDNKRLQDVKGKLIEYNKKYKE